jgi:ABC-type multidrug transport system fused ATPase/permease subunit
MQLTYFSIIKAYAKKHPLNLAGTLLLSVASPVESLFSPHFIGKFGSAVADADFNAITRTLMALGALNLVTVTCYEIDNAIIHDISNGMKDIVFSEYLKKILEQEKKNMLSDLENVSIIAKMNKLSSSIVFYNRQILSIFPSIVSLLLQAIQMLKIDSVLASCIAFMLVGASSLLTAAHVGCSQTLIDKNQDNRLINNHVDEILIHRHSILFANKVDDELNILHEKSKNARTSGKKAILMSSVFTASLSILSISCCIIFLVRLNVIIKKSPKNSKTVQLSTKALATILKSFDHTTNISESIYSLSQNYSNISSILKDLNESNVPEKNVYSPEILTNTSDKNYAIELQNINFSYSEKEIITKKNMKFIKNKIHIIKGSVGSGKSTLLHLISGLLKPNSGQIFLNGEILNESLDALETIGYMSQNTKLFNRSLFENIIYGSEQKHNFTEVEVVMKKFNISFNISLSANVGKNGSMLSGGQKQIVLLLRLFFRNSSILLLDEPSASIDDNLRKTFANMIKILSQEKTVMVVTHDEKFEEILTSENSVEIHEM